MVDDSGAGPGQSAVSGEEQALEAAKGLVDKAAPWKGSLSAPVVIAEGVVLVLAGAVVWLAPGFGARTVLQLLGVILLVVAAMSAYRILRDQVPPKRAGFVGFRAGTGLTVGLIVVIGTFIANDQDATTVALAIVLGIGLVLYGLSALAGSLLRREPGSGFPIAALVISGLAFVVGILLILNGRGGVESLQGTFTLLGIVLLVVGLALAAYGFMLRSRGAAEPLD